MNDSIFNGILIFGVIQSLFFSLLFLTKKGRTLPDKIMGVWLLILGVQTFLILVEHQPQSIPLFKNLSLLMTLLYGPMLFLYISKLNLTKSRLTAIDFVHFIPFFLFFLTFIVASGEKVVVMKLLAGISAFSGIVYCIVCFIQLRNHQNNIENTFSYIEKINLAWVNRLVICLLAIWTGVFILVALNRFLLFNISLDWFFTTIPVFIFYIGYFGIKQQTIYYSYEKEQNSNQVSDIRKQKKSYDNTYVKSSLLPDSMRAIHKKLLTSMQEDRLFLDPTLSLTDLSEKLGLPPHHITQTLNGYAGVNFYDFVNGFRVQEFKDKIKAGEAQNFSLLGIAFDCGFNSKSSFNRIFKKNAGQSPSEYHIGLVRKIS
jgi:AraC-like DNA-binding protein